jgi:sugar O-acyltransferase (sialic acid O-acetyltransferase NeuD family)
MQRIIFGRGGHARVIASLLDCSVTFIGLDDEPQFFERIECHRGADIYLGIGDNGVRRTIFNRLRTFGIVPATCVAPTAFVAKTAEIGAGSVLCPGAVVMTEAVIGENTIINTLSSVDHDCRVGAHTQITVGVNLPGGVTVGENCFFGIKSATFPQIRIGNNVVVRGGSLVIKDVPDGVTVSGNPATIIHGSLV